MADRWRRRGLQPLDDRLEACKGILQVPIVQLWRRLGTLRDGLREGIHAFLKRLDLLAEDETQGVDALLEAIKRGIRRRALDEEPQGRFDHGGLRAIVWRTGEGGHMPV